MKAFHFDNFLGQSEKSLLGFAVLKCFLANSSRFFCDSYVEWLLSLDFWQSHHRLWMQCCSPFWRIAVKKHSQRLFLLSFKGRSCNCLRYTVSAFGQNVYKPHCTILDQLYLMNLTSSWRALYHMHIQVSFCINLCKPVAWPSSKEFPRFRTLIIYVLVKSEIWQDRYPRVFSFYLFIQGVKYQVCNGMGVTLPKVIAWHFFSRWIASLIL